MKRGPVLSRLHSERDDADRNSLIRDGSTSLCMPDLDRAIGA
jgi:hypothetical protein